MELKKQVVEIELKLDSEEFKKELSKIRKEHSDPIVIQSSVRLSKEMLEAEENRLSERLGIRVAIINGGFSLVDIC